MYFRQLLNDNTACASYLLGCKTVGRFAVVDAHIDLVDEYVALAEAQGAVIAAVIETHVQADHVSGLPELVARTGATAYLPGAAGAQPFRQRSLVDESESADLGDTGNRCGRTASASADDRPAIASASKQQCSMHRVAAPPRVAKP